jgi:hypothetical protein
MPLGWVAAAGVVGSLATGAMSADASRSAANAQARSAANAQQISQDQFNTIQQQNAPFTQSGYGALSALDWGLGIGPQTAGGQPAGGMGTGTPTPNGYDPSSGYHLGAGGSVSQGLSNPGGMSSIYPGIGSGPTQGPGMAPQQAAQGGGQTGGLGYGSLTKSFDTSDWQKLSPAYNFQLRQGQQGVMNADAAGAGALSGAAQKDLIDYNQSAANTSFNNAFNQYQTQQGNIFSRLSGIAGLGQSSANNTGQQGTTLAGQAGQAAVAQGSYLGAGAVGSANAWSGAINSATPWLTAGGGRSTPEINTTQIGNNANDVVNNTNWTDTSGYPG